MIAERPGLPLQLLEHAFDPEMVTVQTDDGKRLQFQAGACQAALDPVYFYQDKVRFLVQLLPSAQVNAVIPYGFLLPIELHPRFQKQLFVGIKQLFKMDRCSFFRGTAPSRFFRGWFLKSCAGFLRLSNDFQTDTAAAVKGIERRQGRDSKEIPVQQKNTVPEGLGSAVSVPNHLEYMGRMRNRSPFPVMNRLETVMETDA